MKLKYYRTKHNMSMNQLSNATGISQGYISKLEKGDYEATESKIIRMSLALGVSPNDLLGWDEIICSIKKNFK